MKTTLYLYYHRLKAGIGASLLLVFILVMVVIQAISASPMVANLEGSTKSVNRAQAFPGQTLRYTVVISNSGDMAVPNAAITDTLPLSLTYNEGSLTYTLSSAVTTDLGENNGIITWTGTISELGQVTLYYNAALTETLLAGDEISNSIVITGAGNLISRTSSTTIITSTNLYLPIVYKPVPAPVLNSIVYQSGTQWTASWNAPVPEITGYELQADSDSSFSSPSTFDVGTALFRDFTHQASRNNKYCYRVRALINSEVSHWSNIECIYGNYFDSFNNPPTGWAIRRQDTDDVNNETYYKNGWFVTKVRSRWDYAIAAPMAKAPGLPYRIETRAILEDGADNLQSYGIIFGGDWNGQPCPNSDYNSCFNHYYRLNIIYFGSSSGALRINVKRIDYHDENNVGRGSSLMSYKDISVDNPSGWNKWAVEVSANGEIKIYANGKHVKTVNDTRYINNPYFGVFAATDEYLGTAATYDWYEVSRLP